MRFNHVELFRAVAEALPNQECLVFRNRRLTYAQTAERVNRLANVLLAHGITIRRPRHELQPWESGQDHVALYLCNGNEYIEGMLGAYAARATSFNVNYRYVEDELAYLLDDAQAKVIVYHARFAPTLAAVLPRLDRSPLLLQVADESGHELLPGAVDYERALATASPDAPATEPDPDDLYVLYTGGTTGMPKGTMWAQAEILESALAGFLPEGLFGVGSLDEAVRLIVEADRIVVLPLPPLMHGAAQWIALSGLSNGAKIVFPDVVDRLDAAAVWRIIDQEGVQMMNLVGNTFAKSLCDELEHGRYDGSSLTLIGVGGAVTSAAMKDRLLRLLPNVMIADVAGSSESGSQLSNVSTSDSPATTGTFAPTPDTCVIDDTKTRLLQPGEPSTGWLARHGAIPLGYLGDAEKTAATFPVVDEVRMAVPGDRARHLADGTVELLGRDSVTINSGGEKIFAEEVEEAVFAHPAVDDVIVVGRPSERWGNEVVAVVQLAPRDEPSDDELLATAGERLSRYKLPKAFVRVDAVVRSPAGKADYGWARKIAAATITPSEVDA